MSHNGDNIFVCCRARPHNERERSARSTEVVRLRAENNSVEFEAEAGGQAPSKPISFDKVFDPEASQEEVFASVAVPVMQACLSGYNGTIFAYGQTGSGKTFTVMGPPSALKRSSSSLSKAHAVSAGGGGGGTKQAVEMARQESDGLLPRILWYVFDELDAAVASRNSATSTFTYECRCSYLEIYNEHIYDLTSANHTHGGHSSSHHHQPRSLNLRESTASGVHVEGIHELTVESAEQALAFVCRGNRSRHVSATNMNRTSSRSHSVFSLSIESREVTMADGLTKEKKSKFHLIDLAGSERIKHTKAVGAQVTEAKNINKSLSALGNVIKSLSDIGARGRQRHVP